MTVAEQIEAYLASQPEPKQTELRALHEAITAIQPNVQLWYADGTNDQGKVVANPNIGYGAYEIVYANGSRRDFFRVGLSGNTTGVSVYIMGLSDKKHLAATYGPTIGRASVTGYCIKFKSLNDIDLDVLLAAVAYGLSLPRIG